MTTRKLERSEWRQYFDEVAKRLPAMRVGVSILGDNIGVQLETENGALLGMSYDSNDEVFEVATSNIAHRVPRPDNGEDMDFGGPRGRCARVREPRVRQRAGSDRDD